MKQFKVGILGATGAVGREMMKVLAERDFPAASSRFSAMPTAPAMVPYARRPVGVDGSRPRRNRRQRRVVMVSYNLRGRRRRHYLSPQYFLSRLLSWIASAMCCSSIRSEPSRSATVRATRMTRS